MSFIFCLLSFISPLTLKSLFFSIFTLAISNITLLFKQITRLKKGGAIVISFIIYKQRKKLLIRI